MHLARAQLAAAAKVGTVQGRCAVDDEQGEARLAHHLRRLVQQLQLMIAIVCPCIRNVIQHLLATQPIPIRNRQTPYGAKGAFGVDVQAFPLAAAHVKGQLAGDGEGVADLRLAGAELAKDFGDAARFEAAGEEGVELLGARGDGDELGAAGVHFSGGGEAHGDQFRG